MFRNHCQVRKREGVIFKKEMYFSPLLHILILLALQKLEDSESLCGKRKSPFSCFHLFLMENIIISHGKYSWEKLYFSISTYAWSRKDRLKGLSKVSMLTTEWKIETHFIWLFLSLVFFLLPLSKMSPDVK